MKFRLAITLLVATATVLTVGFATRSDAASSAAAADIPLLRTGTSYTIPNIDQSHTNLAAAVTALSLETLLYLDKNGKLHPWLAERVQQVGKTVYVYHIRKGVKFWDGTELTADDVANSLNYYRDPGSQLAYLYPTVKTIAAISRYKVAVTLKRPDAAWRYAPAQYAAQIFQKKFQVQHGEDFGKPGTLVMGTGPWRVTSLDPTRGAELAAFDGYWGGRPRVRRISVKFFSDETGIALAFRAGQIDAYFPASPQAFAATANTKLTIAPSCQSGWFAMNAMTPPWNDVHVRRAVAWTLNRKDIITAQGAYASPNLWFIPKTMLYLLGSPAEVNAALKKVPYYTTNLAKARAEMALSKYPNGFTTELPFFSYGTFGNVNQVIAKELGQIGIKATAKDVGAGEWYVQVTGPAEKRPPLYATNGCNSPDPSFYSFLLGSNNLKQGVWNVAAYAPKDVDTMIADASKILDPKKRLAVYIKLLQRLYTDVPYVPLFVQQSTLALQPKYTYPEFKAGPRNGPPWALYVKTKSQ